MKTLAAFLLILFVYCLNGYGQTGTIKGKVMDKDGKPIVDASISHENKGTISDQDGVYTLDVPSGKMITIKFSHINYQTLLKRFRVPKNRALSYSPKLVFKTEELDTVVVRDIRDKVVGLDKVDIQTVNTLPSANAGIEGTLKNIGLGVSGNNELSTQYNVRGGNYDENLVYINGIEVYRPFLVRSGQQEGLSFVNSKLTQNIRFSAGGFQAKYGDKLSSVLDITYKTPEKFGVDIEASFLGGSLTFEGSSFQNKLSTLVGIRYRNNSLFVNSKDIESNFKPNFTDVQALLTYQFDEKLSLSLLGNFALNNYNYTPISRRTNFGTILDPKALVVNYDGNEQDQYLTNFGALDVNYNLSDKVNLKLTTSVYNAQEEEHYDILASYGIGDVNANFGSDDFGEVNFEQAIGSQLDHARNDLDALISNISLKSTIKVGDYVIELGAKAQMEDIKDRINEYEIVDSAGFSLRPPYLIGNDEPYTPFTGPIVPFRSIRAANEVKINRLSGFAQLSKTGYLNDTQYWFNVGLRAQHWAVKTNGSSTKGQSIISPRAQLAIKPDWQKDMLFRLSGGYYYQAPFYHELRDSLGMINPDVKAQRSIHFVLGNDYSFKLWARPFKLVTEAYYKSLSNINSYTVDNVQVRYSAHNNATGYAYGIDARLNGEFVPGTESYFTLGFLKTEENINNRGFIARPTDQRFKVAVLFQDYIPTRPNLKLYLNMVYNTGLPGGSPSYADPYVFNNRLKSYFRSDIGISYVFKDAKNKNAAQWLDKLKAFSIGLELFNMFDIQNTITNTWVRDISSSRSIGIPNFLSGRVLNAKINMRF